MKKKFIVAIDSSNNEINDKIIQYAKDNKFGWWHWIQDFWILSTYREVDAATIRNDLNEITLNRKLILEVKEPGSWAGRGPNSDDENMFTWIKENW